ncbi:septal ring lytic transglycosylase RlpA family protein [Methyloceanibacter sp.]|uniref:septal ring lytic transglycosylase RlpA family protein n=1 Tax=Methyloceanibacter sp. TaxID=1965321 RepID=UPI003D6C8B54
MGPVARALAAARLSWDAGTVPLIRLLFSLLLIGSIGASVVACRSGNGERLGERVIPLGQPVPKGGGRYTAGSAYQVDGVWYQPREDSTYDRVGTASWYGELFHGRRTANGEIYDMDRLSAASPTLPMPVFARVTNLQNRRSIIVRVNDRGPYRSDRIIDLSRRSAEALGFRDKGTAQVRVQYLARAPLNGDDSYERRYLASQGWAQFAPQGRVREPGAVGSIAASTRQPPNQLPLADSAGAPLPQQAVPGGAPQLHWQASARAPGAPSPRKQLAGGGRFLIQAGSFRSEDNAERARSLLGGVATVEVAPVEVGGETLFRVRVGPFADENAASAALARVTEAGYTGAKIVMN